MNADAVRILLCTLHLIELYSYGAAYFYPQAPEHVNRAAVLYIPSSSRNKTRLILSLYN